MSRDWRVQVEDIQKAIVKIRAFSAGLDYAAFSADEKTQDAVIRNLEVIGEAARALPEDLKLQTAEVEWRKIVALRNLLVHEYFGVNLPILWDVINTKLDALQEACRRLLDTNVQ